MPSFNKTIQIGHLCADVELKDVGATKVGRIRLAVDDSYKSATGEKVEKTLFIDVEAWGALAETTAKYTSKGSAVLVDGKLQMDTWEDKDSGQKRSKLKIRADQIKFLSFKDKGEAHGEQREPAAATSPSGDEEIPF